MIFDPPLDKDPLCSRLFSVFVLSVIQNDLTVYHSSANVFVANLLLKDEVETIVSLLVQRGRKRDTQS